ncbi:hypothetical protein GCM10009546_14540 [Actinomadura livida]|uniref:Integrase n=1 Tax=Actinomadura livida TaxID=79909 RepID=A0ABN1DVU0_9ACTN|nr:hypothetical protein GCM10010208_58780 [Actinomadura livida]
MLRYTFVTTVLDNLDPRDVRIAARHADPRTTTRYDRARKASITTPTIARRLHGLRCPSKGCRPGKAGLSKTDFEASQPDRTAHLSEQDDLA